MGGDGIFLIHDDGRLIEMHAEPFASEDELQELLATHANVLPGSQIDPAAPRRWMLIDRELGVPAAEAGGNQWSLDHLFVDQDAIPTIVEVKRASDTRIRREVVGQMLDYAANGVRYWPIATLQDRWRNRATNSGRSPEAMLQDLTGSAQDPEEFWQRMEANLRAGRVRLLFVADRIPAELQRIVEFLNEQMRPAEVLALELRHYRGGDARTLVPRVLGATALARQAKAASDPRTFDNLLADAEPQVQEADRLLQDWAAAHRLETGRTRRARQVKESSGRTVVQMYADQGWIEVPLGALADAGFAAEAEQIGRQMDRLAGRELSRRSPGLPARQTVPAWRDFVDAVLDPYLEVQQRAKPDR